VKDTWGDDAKATEKNQKEMDMSEEEGQIGTWDNKEVKAQKTDDSWGAKGTDNVKGSDTWGDKNKNDPWGSQKTADEPTWGNQNAPSDTW